MNVITLLCQFMDWNIHEVQSKSRKMDVVSKRRILAIAASRLGYSLNEIGRMINRKHPDVHHLINGMRLTHEETEILNRLNMITDEHGIKPAVR